MKFSLRTKSFLFISLLMIILCGSLIIANRTFIRRLVGDHFAEDARSVSDTVAATIDPEKVNDLCKAVVDIYRSADNKVTSDKWGTPEFDEYISLYKGIEEREDFIELRDWMRKVQEASSVDCIYIVWFMEDGQGSVYLCDAALEDACPPGCIDMIFSDNMPSMEDPEVGLMPYESITDEYGWLVTSASPIHYNGEVIAYAGVDVTMESIIAEQNRSTLYIAVLAIIITIILGVLGILIVDHYVVRPINRLSGIASTYKGVSAELGGLERNDFAMLDIKTGDEIESLANSMKKMERDLNDQIETLFATKQELMTTREQADIMNEMANRDALTGIRNKRGYDTEIQRINKEIVGGRTDVAIVMVDMNGLKNINDNYGHEKGDKVICSLCDVLCSIFKRSPVFRIGGDEFVVVVEHQDFINLDKNVDQFKACIEHNMTEEDLEPWERVSAAIGSAIYDPEQDCGIEDTLKRADELMYANKREMKKL